PWASLPQDLLELIAWRVLAGDLLDYVRFRSVCSHWNSSTVPPRGRGLVDPRFHPRRWMLFPEGYGLYPGHPNLGGVCAAVTVNAAGAITVMLCLDTKRRVAYAATGDRRWSLSAWKLPRLRAVTMSFQGKFYAMAVNSADKNNVYICRIDPPQPSAEGNHSLSLPPPRMLVKSPLDGGLMVLGFTDVSLAHLVVYRVSDLTKGRVAPLTSIGEHAIFSEVHALCISAKRFPSILGNSIICKNRSSRMVETHDFNPLLGRRAVRPAHPLVEQYDLGSDTWSPAIDEDIVHSDRTPASPYTLAHHIFTCCCRYYW
uniref:KIB1-4 beta-propeller domain-containing protein n=1 Tax=Setaria italica TaxID=4555 RepID=K3XRB9_SETIT